MNRNSAEMFSRHHLYGLEHWPRRTSVKMYLNSPNHLALFLKPNLTLFSNNKKKSLFHLLSAQELFTLTTKHWRNNLLLNMGNKEMIFYQPDGVVYWNSNKLLGFCVCVYIVHFLWFRVKSSWFEGIILDNVWLA